ncbi:uncharacterized protein (DUF1697 family) [Caulobacter ginsengisoli]|uniref:Uncharacterized protein (DUF1697 family) n=1 Tax=Caulobacter ginsengisoli TaxID=400775 RepID=A0ABU0IXF5_9CAUL|nr:DUF1697 domain-containing protein [Caulobacter ginsengisoli]MDQ0466684.1 uncharacterized protein (DUF1697 family) [Caulobacter ginsengisoli]
MTVWIALLGSVNVGGRRIVMTELKALAVDLGFDNPRTLLASGNLVFSASGTADEVAARLETALAERFGFKCPVMLRSAADWDAVIAANPFPDKARDDPGHLIVTAFKSPVPAEAVERLRAVITGPEIVEGRGRELYFVYPEGMGRSALTPALVDRALRVRGTGRNWNTTLKLGALAAA